MMMAHSRARGTRGLLPQAVAALMLATCAGCHLKTAEEWDKERFDQQVADIQAGKSDTLHFYDVHGADALLKGVSGMRGIKRVVIESMNDITDAGIQEIARLPGLKALSLYETQITNRWLELLQTSESLEELDLTPYRPLDFKIASVLALPHLQKLQLEIEIDSRDPGADEAVQWVDSALQGLKAAKSLKELELTGPEFVKRKQDLALLQKELPSCEIKLYKTQRTSDPLRIPLMEGE